MNIENWLSGLGRISVQGGALVVLVLLAQWLFRKQLTARWRSALWLLVVVRLLVPLAPGSAASIFNFVPYWQSAPPTAAAVEPAAAPGKLAVPRLTTPPRPAATIYAAESAPPMLSTPNPSEPNPRVTGPKQSALVPPPAKATPTPIRWADLLLWGWLSGVLSLGGYVLASSARMAWRCRRLPLISNETVLTLLNQCAKQMGVRRQLEIVESVEVSSPALFGLFRPRLMLPKGFLENFTEQELRFVFLHELAHLKRHDLPLNWLVTLLQILHWFNPLLWLGFARWRSDRELACDALALEAAGDEQKQAYGRTILHLLENFTHRTPAPGLVGIMEDKGQLHRRIGMIASFRPGKRWGLLSVTLLALLAVVGLTDAQSPKPVKPETAKSATVATVNPTRTNTPANHGEERIGADPMPEIGATNVEARTLTVTVLDPEGKPLPGAEVQVPYIGDWSKPQPRRLTDANGQFIVRFTTVPREFRREMSNFSVSASHPKFVHRSTMWTAAGGDVYASMPDAVTIKLERGGAIGGVVLDEKGRPLAGIRVLLSGSGYQGFTMGNNERNTHQYSEVSISLKDPAATSDAGGRWSFDRFPSDLSNVEVTLVRPDDSRETFSTSDESGLNQRPKISLEELQAGKLVTRLSEGVPVRGIVVDEDGQALPDVTVKEGYGHGNIVRISEFKTDANGRFERGHRTPRQWIYTATRPDRATMSVVAQVEPGMPEVRIVLPPAKPWIARVTDEHGKPVTDVAFRLDTYRTEAQILDWSGETDANGRVVWTNAPFASVTLYASSKSAGSSRKVRIVRGEAEQPIVLSKTATTKVSVRVKAVDADTRQPVKLQSVAARYEGGGSPFKPLDAPKGTEYSAEIKRSDFRVGMYPSYALKLEAEGYETFTTEYIDFDFGDQDLVLALRRSAGAGGVTVLQPDGKPAGGARLWTRAKSDDGNLFINAPGRYYGDRMTKAQADDDGHIKLPGAPDDAPVVIAHTNGLLETTMAEVRRQREVRLAGFGAVQGRLLVAGKPKSGANISLSTLSWAPSLGFHLSYTATTDPDGRFTFTQVPPGKFKLYRWGLPKRRDTSGMAITETSQMPVTVMAGQTNTVEYSRAGRAVVGQAIPAQPDVAVDWQSDVHTLSLKLPNAPAQGRANREDYATFEAFRKANDASFQSQSQVQQAILARTYALEFESDGSFRIEDVPPGTYELRIRVTKNDESAPRRPFGNPDELGSLTREIIVPEGKEALDLGTLAVPMKGGSPAQSAPSMAFNATTLDGRPLTLGQFKGKHVVLVFWASWSERSLEQLAQLKQLQAQYASDPRLVFVGINLDESSEAARKIVTANHYDWAQGWIDTAGRAKVAAAFDVNRLPAIFLLDPEGRIVARELGDERLPATLKRTLARK